MAAFGTPGQFDADRSAAPACLPLPPDESSTANQSICYIRADTPALADPLVAEVSRYASAHGHTVVTRYRDSVSGPASGRRPGFGHCLRALSAGLASTVIVPTLDHLAATERLREWVTTEIHEFGGQLLVVSPDADPALGPATDPSHHYIPGPI
jgi:hypothetical protein